MSPRRSVLVLAFAASLAGSQPEAESPTAYRVRTWSGRTIDARAIQFSTAALTIETGNAQQTLGWHEVHAIEGPRAADAAEQIALGKIVWRAGVVRVVPSFEPTVADELRSMAQVVLAPHLGSATIATREKMGSIAVDNCLAGCRGDDPPQRIN